MNAPSPPSSALHILDSALRPSSPMSDDVMDMPHTPSKATQADDAAVAEMEAAVNRMVRTLGEDPQRAVSGGGGLGGPRGERTHSAR